MSKDIKIEETDGKKSIDDLKSEFENAKSKIKKLIVKRDAKKGELSKEEKNELRTAYMNAGRYAKLLAKRVVESDVKRQYEKSYEQLVACARKYGSTARENIPSTKLDDVKGLKEVKKVIENFIFIANNESLISSYKLSGGLGIMMYGPPGTGKTLIAEAIANAMNVPFFIITPADIYKSYVGESEESVKMIFEEIEACEEGAVLFVDECESIFSKRTADTKDYKSAVTTELLQRMNGFGVNGSKRVMIGATNRPDMIDPAYLRFKRFSTIVFVDLPDKEAKLEIIKSKLPPIGLDETVTIDMILELSCKENMNYSAADICGIIESACMNAITTMQERKLTEPIPLSYEMINKAFDSFVIKLTDEAYASYKNFKIETSL